jgi:DNA-binding HxlR family transcriptional regulator
MVSLLILRQGVSGSGAPCKPLAPASQAFHYATMVKRIDPSGAECPIARSLGIVGDGWSLLIVRDAAQGRRRFGEFQKSLGIARNILSARLKTLAACGILKQTEAGDYVLTSKGEELGPVLGAFRDWGTKWVPPAT